MHVYFWNELDTSKQQAAIVGDQKDQKVSGSIPLQPTCILEQDTAP